MTIIYTKDMVYYCSYKRNGKVIIKCSKNRDSFKLFLHILYDLGYSFHVWAESEWEC